jgi:hypothetical protein
MLMTNEKYIGEQAKRSAYNLRFGATAAEARMKLPCEIEKPFAAEIAVEAAAAPSRCVVGCNARKCGEKLKKN